MARSACGELEDLVGALGEDLRMHPSALPDRPAGQLALLRQEVGRFRAAEQRRRFPTTLHIGRLEGDRTAWEVPAAAGPLDRATAFDLLDCGLAAALPAEVDAWVTRPGVPELHDEDLLWLTVTSAAVAARGSALVSFHAVTRTGWLDVRTGETRVWVRLRLDR
jgi:hypothetical protein